MSNSSRRVLYAVKVCFKFQNVQFQDDRFTIAWAQTGSSIFLPTSTCCVKPECRSKTIRIFCPNCWSTARLPVPEPYTGISSNFRLPGEFESTDKMGGGYV